ncbi:MAG TPA: hypothetical protein PLF84_20365, partial [Bryobacteraceae bacterium]|nr:hypothetical protein [Bryobacteraceae bacterium]
MRERFFLSRLCRESLLTPCKPSTLEGFEQDGWLTKAWGGVVDMVVVGMVWWVVSGLIMWWKLPGKRRGGWVALGLGVGSWVVFMGWL